VPGTTDSIRTDEILEESAQGWAALTSSDSGTAASPTWVKVPAVFEKKALQSSPASGNLLIHIREIVVEVPVGFDAVTLRSVISAVQTPW